MSDPHMEPAVLAAMGAYVVVGGLVVLALIAFSIVCYWRIAVKAGYSGPLSLLLLVPGANLVLIIIFAFSDWPIERELRALRSGGYAPGGPSGPGSYTPPGGYVPPGPPMTTGG